MPPFLDVKQAMGPEAAQSLPHVWELFVRMVVASILGAFVAYRVWRRIIPHASPPPSQSAQTQTLIAAAGALMVVVIGDNVARAFGLVGLGSFIRFRSGIGDPRDAAVMFVMIGIGMACGLGFPLMAAAGTLFISVLLVIFDLTVQMRRKRCMVLIIAEDPPAVWPRIAQLFPNTRVVELSGVGANLGKDTGKLVVEVDLRGNMDASTIRQILQANGVGGVSRVALVE